MMLDPQVVAFAALAMAIGWTMTFSGLKKNALELKHRRRICPSCGRNISGAVCREH
jgi:formate dehydrogenase maturation protein FdhE